MRDVASTVGAGFVRSDLHIHSYGDDGSYDVTDSTMTPTAIVDTAIEKGLSIISITDHNEILNAKHAIKHAEGKSIFVVPGIEVTTTQGHLLAYFESFEKLRSFYSILTISPDKQRCDQGIKVCLDKIKELDGIAILAHIELDSGFEKVIGRFSGVIEDFFTHPALVALEISTKNSLFLYTDFDDSDNSTQRKLLVSKRREALGHNTNQVLPKVLSSDSHTLLRLGTNAEGNNKVTRVKIEEQSFSALKIAFLTGESRIRIEDDLPERIPRFTKMTIDGGLLDKQDIRFSSNLTCIIGGRGAGKSTMLESLREASGNQSEKEVVDSEVWPDIITIEYEDETGRTIQFRREKNSISTNSSDPLNGISIIPIESYGQGAAASTLKHSEDNPKALLDFFDEFIDIRARKEEEEEIRALLIGNRSELEKRRIELVSEDEIKRKISDLESKIAKMESEKIGELVKLQQALVIEKDLRDEITGKLGRLIKQYSSALSDTTDFKYFASIDKSKIIVGASEFIEVQTIIAAFSAYVGTTSTALSKELTQKVEDLRVQIALWKDKEKGIQDRIDAKKAELAKEGIVVDIGAINQVTKDLSYYKERQRKLAALRLEIKEYEKERRELIARQKSATASIFYQRSQFAAKINENLKATVDGFQVTAKFKQGCYSEEFEILLKTTMDWRTSQVPKSQMLASSMSPLEFAECFKKGDFSTIRAIKGKDSQQLFSESEITSITERIGSKNIFEEFESLQFADLPSLTVSKEYFDSERKRQTLVRPISKLSLGQQQSILLAILIQSNSTRPLLIDQPEDNLDSEFIFKTIVGNLKRVKERRQVIIVTHNANIAVLGDAELVIPLRSTSIKSAIVNPGSIDCTPVRKLCCEILEGGEQAFKSRKEIYGY